MVTKGYIVHVYDENGARLDDRTGFIRDASNATQADVWLPIFDDNAVLNDNSTIGRADLALIPHTKIPLQVQSFTKQSAVLCAIQDFDLSTLVILGYLHNANNERLAPYARMHLGSLEVNDDTTLNANARIKLSKDAIQANNLDKNESYYVSHADLESLYGIASGSGIRNIGRAFVNTGTLIGKLGTASGFYSITKNSVAEQCIDTVLINLVTWASSYETYNIRYTLSYNGVWTIGSSKGGQQTIQDISSVGLDITYLGGTLRPDNGSVITIVFNTAVPISAGGTGGTTAEEARKNLGIFETQVISQSEFDATTTSPNTIYYIYS